MKKYKQHTSQPGQHSPKKLGQILLIDDDQEENEFHEQAINQSGLAEGVKSISNSEEALKYLGHCLYSGNNPDLIFLDVMMPRLNGYELLDKYRGLMTVENYPKGKIKIFILSCLPDDKEMDFYLYSPVYKDLVIGYRQKPLTVDMLKQIQEEYFETPSPLDFRKGERPRYRQARLSMTDFPSSWKD